MKSIKFYSTIFILTIALVTFSVISCDKSIESLEVLTPLEPADLDEDAGTWDMIILTSADQIAVPAPAAVGSDAYTAELNAIKTAQSELTSSQRKAIEYWSGGGVLRWNQIFRELVAQYNLPPAPRANGTYPAPDAENPFADPNFPFANPPYAARAYSYASVAIYESLKAAWHYKYLYKRDAPYKNDPEIKALVPKTDLYSYPSEDAAMSGVAAEVMKAMFPAALELITLKAAEQRNAALWSGKAAASDISAGLALGKAVAVQVMNRARTDGMATAGGSPALWKQLETNVGFGNHTGETPWISLETPIRPPMLPNFSFVLGWNMTAQDIIDERPVAPPQTASSEMKSEVEEVKYYTDNLTRERLAIVHKWADGAGTYTPPGHWNDIAAEYIRDANYSEVRAARAFSLLNMAEHDAAVACWETKFYYFNPRPTQLNPEVKTGTGIPNFPAFTSGHSTFSGAAAAVLSYLFPAGTNYFNEEALEASMSRLYGGIHYRKDCEVGLVHGMTVGGYTVNYASTDGADD